jgi:hypothetical protein
MMHFPSTDLTRKASDRGKRAGRSRASQRGSGNAPVPILLITSCYPFDEKDVLDLSMPWTNE